MDFPVLSAAELTDRATTWPTVGHRELAAGKLFGFVEDRVTTPDGGEMVREYLRHTGSVGIIALDDRDRVALVQQYRHPVGFELIEPPAGLLDVLTEDPLDAARRELAEEVGLAADQWAVLVDVFNSPGCSDEFLRIFLARGLRSTPAPDGFEVHGEEAHMRRYWAHRDDLTRAVFAGRLANPVLVAGVLALAATGTAYASLRPAHTPWPARDQRPVRTGA
ncbi:NUDIX domain-containing protein [Granulicoccus phenolivorans]|uniref:NUDIX domain-containing protein n=1 Tax=Granulicoccus phenolivorans TaxID=266854 RepID=UPI0004102DAA|nr:NUDIX hydrolase [Granulicoccus phenolivorans]